MKTKNRKERKNRPAMVYSLSLFIILAFASVATAATVSVQPHTQNLAPGATFTFTVNVDSGSDNLHAAKVELTYDTNVLEVDSITKGSLLGSGILEAPAPDTDLDTPGSIKYSVTRTASNPDAQVNGIYLTVDAHIKSGAPAGISLLDLTTATLKKTASTNIPVVNLNDGNVNVTGGSGGGNGDDGGADDEAMVYISPHSQDKSPGATFSVNVMIDSGVNTLSGAKIELNYNTNVLVINSITNGNLLGSGSGILEAPDNDLTTPGSIKYGVVRTASNPAAAVDGTFLTIAFQVKGSAPSGISLLDLSNVILKKTASTNIVNTTVTDGQVNVLTVPPESETPVWRFISVPYELNNSTVAYVLDGVNYESLLTWDASAKTWSAVTNFEPLKGYLIKMNLSETLNLEQKSGATVPPSVEVHSGWNLIGTSGTTARNAETMLITIDDSYKLIWNWNAMQQKYDDVGINRNPPIPGQTPKGTEEFMMESGISYWVWLKNAASLAAIATG